MNDDSLTDGGDGIHWKAVRNVFTEAIPANALMKIVDIDDDDEDAGTSAGTFQVSQPDADSMTGLLVNGATDIPIGLHGQGHNEFPCAVLFDGNGWSPAVGDLCGSAANSWLITTGKTGYKIQGGDTTDGLVVVAIQAIPAVATGGVSNAWDIATPAAFTTDQNPFSPSNAVVQRISSTGPVKIITMSPLSGGDNSDAGRIHVLVNVGAYPISLIGDFAAANGNLAVGAPTDFTSGYYLGPGETALMYRDSPTGDGDTDPPIWRIINLNPWSTPPTDSDTKSISGTTNDLVINNGPVTVVAAAHNGSDVLTGIAGGYHGRRIMLVSDPSTDHLGYWISFGDANSSAANRIYGMADHEFLSSLGDISTGSIQATAITPAPLGQVFIESSPDFGAGMAIAEFIYNDNYPGWVLFRSNNWNLLAAGRDNSANDYAYLTKQLSFHPDHFRVLKGIAGEITVSRVSPLTITGSRGGNAALANLLTALATLNIIVDSTT